MYCFFRLSLQSCDKRIPDNEKGKDLQWTLFQLSGSTHFDWNASFISFLHMPKHLNYWLVGNPINSNVHFSFTLCIFPTWHYIYKHQWQAKWEKPLSHYPPAFLIRKLLWPSHWQIRTATKPQASKRGQQKEKIMQITWRFFVWWDRRYIPRCCFGRISHPTTHSLPTRCFAYCSRILPWHEQQLCHETLGLSLRKMCWHRKLAIYLFFSVVW